MSSSSRLKVIGQPGQRQKSMPLSSRSRSSGFHPSSEASTLTRQIAIARMLALSLTTRDRDASPETLDQGGNGSKNDTLRCTDRLNSTAAAEDNALEATPSGRSETSSEDDVYAPWRYYRIDNTLWRTTNPFSAPPAPWPNNSDVAHEIGALMGDSSVDLSPKHANPVGLHSTEAFVPRRSDSGATAVQRKPISEWMEQVEESIAETDGGEKASVVRTPLLRAAGFIDDGEVKEGEEYVLDKEGTEVRLEDDPDTHGYERL